MRSDKIYYDCRIADHLGFKRVFHYIINEYINIFELHGLRLMQMDERGKLYEPLDFVSGFEYFTVEMLIREDRIVFSLVIKDEYFDEGFDDFKGNEFTENFQDYFFGKNKYAYIFELEYFFDKTKNKNVTTNDDIVQLHVQKIKSIKENRYISQQIECKNKTNKENKKRRM